jgi:hypothetical protein
VRGIDESGDGFEDEAHPMDIISSVDEEAKSVEYDTPYNRGFVWILDPGYGEGQEVVWEYDATSTDEVIEWTEPEWASPDEQFVEVVVRSRLDDTSATDGVGPGGKYRIWETWPVYYEHDYPPIDGATHFIDISAEDDPSQQYVADEAARTEARELARKYSKGQYAGTMTVAFNPLLEPYDVYTVAADREDISGRYRLLWRCVIDGIEHGFAEELETRLSFIATIARSRKIGEPTAPVAGLSAGVVQVRAPVTHLLFADVIGQANVSGAIEITRLLGGALLGVGGFKADLQVGIIPAFFNDAEGFAFDDAVTSAFADNDAAGFWIDESLSGGDAGNDASGFWVDLPGVVLLGGELAGTGSLTGQLQISRELPGVVAGAGTMSATLTVGQRLVPQDVLVPQDILVPSG